MAEKLNFLDIKDVAEMLGKHTKTIRRWIKDGKLTAYKIEGKYHIKEKDVNDFIENSKL